MTASTVLTSTIYIATIGALNATVIVVVIINTAIGITTISGLTVGTNVHANTDYSC